MRRSFLALLFVGLPLMAFSAEAIACGKRSLGRATRVEEIKVRAGVKLPSFYLRGDNDVILFFQHDEVLARTSQRAGEYRKQGLEHAAERSELLLAELKSSQPFADYADLFRYSLRTPSLGLEIRALAADLLSEGKAAVMQRGLTASVGSPIAEVHMYFRLNQNDDPVAKWFCTAAGSSLLRITYYVD